MATVALAIVAAPIASAAMAEPTCVTRAPKPAALISRPTWLQTPSADDMAEFYPQHPDDVSDGCALLQCQVGAGGQVRECRVLMEDPPNVGFGRIALQLSRRFRMTARDGSGRPTAGRPVRIPIRFQAANDP